MFKSKTRIARDVMSVSDLKNAKLSVVRLVQSPLHSLLNSLQMLQHSPFVDDAGVIRVGASLSNVGFSSL